MTAHDIHLNPASSCHSIPMCWCDRVWWHKYAHCKTAGMLVLYLQSLTIRNLITDGLGAVDGGYMCSLDYWQREAGD